jgi:hypothetical protein
MQELLKRIAVTAELMGSQITPAAAAVMALDLSTYNESDVFKALELMRRESTRFSEKAIFDALEKVNPDGRLGADEAWATIPQDESLSAVITEEMAEAYGIALPILQGGDKVAARRSFIEAYQRIVAENKANNVPVKWFPSLGHNQEMCEEVVKNAIRLGRLGSESLKLLPNVEPVMALEDKRVVSNSDVRKNLKKLRAVISNSPLLANG